MLLYLIYDLINIVLLMPLMLKVLKNYIFIRRRGAGRNLNKRNKKNEDYLNAIIYDSLTSKLGQPVMNHVHYL